MVGSLACSTASERDFAHWMAEAPAVDAAWTPGETPPPEREDYLQALAALRRSSGTTLEAKGP